MPQLDISLYASQIFWLAISFTVLFLLLQLEIVPRIHRFVKYRANKIQADLDFARADTANVTDIQEQYEALLAKARLNASNHIQETADALQKKTNAANQKLTKKLEADMTAAEERIRAFKLASREALTASAKTIAKHIYDHTQEAFALEGNNQHNAIETNVEKIVKDHIREFKL
jgi:F-type H+-transporting ATPase subunit b